MSGDERERSRDRERSRRDRPSRFSETSRDRSPDRGGRDRGGKQSSHCRVYLSNIPYEYRWQDLKDLFRNQVGDVEYVELFVDENEKPRGCGIVEFADPDSVKKCLDVMHRFEVKGRKLVIKEDFGNQRDKFGNIISSGSKRNRDRDESRERRAGRGDRCFDQGRVHQEVGGNEKWGNTYGLSPQFLESLWINTPLINRVFVANLDYKVDKKKLKEVFKLAGRVQKIDLSLDKDGHSRGFAVVEYDHPVEGVQAISMFHNQQLYDRAMTVRMDRASDRENVKLPEGLKGVGMGLGVNGEPLKDVARNLPSMNNTGQPMANTGAGILGAVPTSALQLGINNAAAAAALSNLNSVVGQSGLSSLNSNSAVLQAANLAGMGSLSNNLLANSLGGGDLSLAAAGLVNNSLIQNQSLANLSSNNSSNVGNFGRNDNSFGGNQAAGIQSLLQQNQGFGSGNRNFQNSFDQKSNFNFNSDRDRSSLNNVYSTVNNGSQMLRSTGNIKNESTYNIKNETSYGSKKIAISNLPATASFKLLSEKCREFGDVQRVEDKGNGMIVVSYGNDWEAEAAIKNMNHARIDGRTIDVRFYY